MKIAIIAPYWNPPAFRGGVSRVIFELRKCWTRNGHTVDIFASTASSDRSKGVFRLPCPPVPYRTAWNNLLLMRFNRLKNYDIIFPQSAIACIFLPRNKTVPFVHTLSDIEHKSPLRPWRYGHQVLERWAMRGVSKCFTLDSRTAQNLKARCGMRSTDIHHVRNGVDHHKFSPGPRTRKSGFRIISAGRFVPRKRFDNLIRIVARFMQSRSDVTLQIAGDGELKSDLIFLSRRLGIEESVQFLGQVEEDQLIDHFQQASVFMFTSEAEGMPMVLLEAQSCGLPVITSAFESARILVEDGVTGFVIDGYESRTWVDGLNLLYEYQSLREDLSRNARRRVMDSFTWDQTSSMIMNCFHDVVSAGAKR